MEWVEVENKKKQRVPELIPLQVYAWHIMLVSRTIWG